MEEGGGTVRGLRTLLVLLVYVEGSRGVNGGCGAHTHRNLSES